MRLAFALCLYSTQADSIHTPHPHHIYSADFFSNLDKNRLKLLSHKSPQEKTKQTRTKTKQKQIMAFRTTPINEDEHTQFLRKYSDSAKFDAVKLTHDRILIFQSSGGRLRSRNLSSEIRQGLQRRALRENWDGLLPKLAFRSNRVIGSCW